MAPGARTRALYLGARSHAAPDSPTAAVLPPRARWLRDGSCEEDFGTEAVFDNGEAAARARGHPAACSERGRGGGALRCRAAQCGFRAPRRFWNRSGTARRYHNDRRRHGRPRHRTTRSLFLNRVSDHVRRHCPFSGSSQVVRCIQSCNKLHYSQLLRLRSGAAAGLLLASSYCTLSELDPQKAPLRGAWRGKVSSRHCATSGSCESCALSGLLACSLERLGRCLGRCVSRGVRSRGWWLSSQVLQPSISVPAGGRGVSISSLSCAIRNFGQESQASEECDAPVKYCVCQMTAGTTPDKRVCMLVVGGRHRGRTRERKSFYTECKRRKATETTERGQQRP